MNDQSPNSAFRDTSFLQGANAAYVEQLYGQWAKDPAAVDHAWDEYFRSLGEAQATAARGAQGASWARPDWPPMPADENTAALTGEWPMASQAEAKAAIKKITAKADEIGEIVCRGDRAGDDIRRHRACRRMGRADPAGVRYRRAGMVDGGGGRRRPGRRARRRR